MLFQIEEKRSGDGSTVLTYKVTAVTCHGQKSPKYGLDSKAVVEGHPLDYIKNIAAREADKGREA